MKQPTPSNYVSGNYVYHKEPLSTKSIAKTGIKHNVSTKKGISDEELLCPTKLGIFIVRIKMFSET